MIMILHVDDHPVLRTTMKQIIKGCVPRAHIDGANNGETALEMVAQKNYDLILLDISMPGTNTVHLARKILEDRHDTRILLFTGNSEFIYAKKYLQLGVLGYITKDASLHDIEDAIKTVMKGERYACPALSSIIVHRGTGINHINNVKRA
jgi:two-component system, NarL family, invasion response regulator UvrY